VNDLVIVRGCRFRRRPAVEKVSQEVKEDEMDIPRVVSPGEWLAARKGTDGPGVSVFLREGDRVFHTYSAYERGLDSLLGTYRWLELTPLGRQRHVIEFPYHDTYDQDS